MSLKEEEADNEFRDWGKAPEGILEIQTSYGFDFLSPAAQKMLSDDCRTQMPPEATRVLIIGSHNGSTPQTATGFYSQYVYYKDEDILTATPVLFTAYGRTTRS